MTAFVKLNDTDTNGDPISIDDWAERTLPTEEYYAYLEAKARQDAILEQATDNGILVVEEVYESIYSNTLNENVKVCVGTKISIKEGYTVEGDPAYLEFEARYAKDPTVNYRPVNN